LTIPNKYIVLFSIPLLLLPLLLSSVGESELVWQAICARVERRRTQDDDKRKFYPLLLTN